jgi:catechol 2,3-dioxygenase-like lactoylglutathione lyase family enzyme
MGRFLPDVSINAYDREAAADYYQRVFGLERGRTGENWVELLAGPFRFFVCNDGMPSGMFAFATDDVAGTVAAMVAEGGRVIKQNETETFVTDRYGITVCVEQG